MKKIIVNTCLVSLALLTFGCSNETISQTNLSQDISGVSSLSTKTDFNKSDFKETAFSKFADKKSKNSYKADASVFNKKPVKNGLLDNLFGSKDFPFKSFFDFDAYASKEKSEYFTNQTGDFGYTENVSIYNEIRDTTIYDKAKAKSHFDKNLNAYLTAHEMYKSTKKQMQRFILLDVLANGVSGIPYSETHNPPFQPNYKLKPTEAALIMPALADMANYNIYGKKNPHVSWDWTKAKQFYHDNYARFMGMIMEFGPNKEDAYSLVHREISEAAWTGH